MKIKKKHKYKLVSTYEKNAVIPYEVYLKQKRRKFIISIILLIIAFTIFLFFYINYFLKNQENMKFILI